MNPRQFFEKVAELRQAQREYFRTRLPDALRKSRAIEAEVGREIRRVRLIEAERERAEAARAQGSLFADECDKTTTDDDRNEPL